MTTKNTDIDNIDAAPEPLVLTTGLPVLVERLKTRQTMRLLKILTAGAGPALADLRFDGDDTEGMTAQILGTILFAIPDAEEETIDFVQSMVIPAGLIDSPHSKPEKEVNAELFERLARDLENPELDDLVSIIEVVVRNEAPHLAALGKRLGLLLNVARPTTAQKKPSRSSSATSKN